MGMKHVYLTFDDGPIPEITPAVLDILRKEGVHATFFMVGENAQRYPELVDKVRHEGHRIGCHTFHHIKGWGMGVTHYVEDVDRCDSYLGGTRLFRPPYGRIGIRQWLKLRRRGYRIVMWNVLTRDYNPQTTQEAMLKRVKRSRNGSIIVFHDSIKAGKKMLEALPDAINYLKNKGFTFETIAD